jgi:hypothetical protein
MSEPPKPPHGRKLGLTGTALTKARNPKGDVQALSAVRDELEVVLIESGYCEDAPFSWVTISIRFGLKEESEPHYQAINKKYGDLPLAIEVPTEKMQGASLDELKRIFKDAALRALIHAGEKHGRPVSELKSMAAEQ